MTHAEQTDDAPRFTPLAEYQAPAMPTRDTFQILATRARELLHRGLPEPMVADTRLHRSTLDMLDTAVPPPACGPLIDELQASLSDWLNDPAPDETSRLIVLPPGDRDRIVARWAERYGHALCEAPARDELLAPAHDPLPEPDGDGVLVLPALEDWFVRHQSGLALIRALLVFIQRSERRIVVGCNSWAWQYLVRAVHADTVLSAPIIFQPFDAERLRQWFSRIAATGDSQSLRFLDARSGDDILAEDDDRAHDRLCSLAARSQGIPWVAWRLWRQSLRRHIPDQDDADTPAEDDQTLWLTDLDEFSLPGRNGDDSLLALHALLIHGPLPPAWLDRLLPSNGASKGLSGMLNAGIVERHDDGRLACAPAAYPTIRAGLATAGFPTAAI